MAGRSRFYSEKPYLIKNCIDQRKDIFVAKVKGYFSKSEYNNLLLLPPIFRNIEIENKEEVIGEYMYSQAINHSLPMTKKDRKLTTLLDTNGQYMVFNNYYLWLFIDLGFFITDYKAIAVFEKNTACEPFVRTMMNLRIQAILAGSSKEKFYKLIINASYGYDTPNTEKFGKIKFLDKADTFIAQHQPNHTGTRRIRANTFAVQIKPKPTTCFTSLQSGVLTQIMRNIGISITYITSYDSFQAANTVSDAGFSKKVGIKTVDNGINSLLSQPIAGTFGGIKDAINSVDAINGTISTLIDTKRILKNKIEALEQLCIDWNAFWKAIYEVGIKFACESKICQ
ncbi:MAG: hypothetical protein EZS28_018720 [Streblomastix strix]|uniref:Uncharacterized protein n=1 Tax=Streblomastix strix TaxID=222440 RepID=A0A5J4VT22_9EUKA|nr:MAG: hypothetical protein EZS28_018720 [Streblomastix strix]